MKRPHRLPLLAAGLSLLGLSPALASPARVGAQSIIVNPAPTDLQVDVSVSKPGENPVYRIGEPIQVGVTVNQDAYVYLFSIHADGEIEVILPNRYQGGASLVRAGERRSFPAPGASFRFTVGGPAGQDKVLAVASRRQLNTDEIYRFEGAGPLAVARVRGQENLARALSVVVEPIPPADWVTAVTYYQVVGSAAAQPSTTPVQPAPAPAQPARNPATRFVNLPTDGASGVLNPGPSVVIEGARVRNVRLRLIDAQGRTVSDQFEQGSYYCLKGGGERCDAWDTRQLPNGTYRVIADITLADGRTYQYEGRVRIDNPPARPTTRFNNVPNDNASGVINPGPELVVDGARVRSARLRLLDSQGRARIDQTEDIAKLCLNGGDDRCAAWDTRKLPNGDYRLVADITLADGRTYRYEERVRINNARAEQPPLRLRGSLELGLPAGASIARINDDDGGDDRDELEFDLQSGLTIHRVLDYYEQSLGRGGWRTRQRKGDDRQVTLDTRRGNETVVFTIDALGNNRYRVKVQYRS